MKTLQDRYNRDLSLLSAMVAIGLSATACLMIFIIWRQQKMIASLA